jgi:hypothetical protein
VDDEAVWVQAATLIATHAHTMARITRRAGFARVDESFNVITGPETKS